MDENPIIFITSKYRQIANEFLEKLINELKFGDVKFLRKGYETFAELNNGTIFKTVLFTDDCKYFRGRRCNKIYIDKNLKKDTIGNEQFYLFLEHNNPEIEYFE